MLGVIVSKEEYEEYQILKKKNTPMRKIDGAGTDVALCVIM